MAKKNTKQSLTTKRTLAKIPSVRDVIVNEMKAKGWTAYKLSRAVAGKMTAQTVYDYVAEPQRTKINDVFVGHLLTALNLEIRPAGLQPDSKKSKQPVRKREQK